MGTQYCLFVKGEPIKYWQVQSKDKWPPKIMIWGLIHSKGVGKVIVCPDTVDKHEYVRILKKGLLPWIRDMDESEYVFMQDGAPAHTSNMALDLLAENGVNVMEWPGNSPDLNPIENIWCYLKQELGKK